MTKCSHDIAEQETACADGMCPLCLAKQLAHTEQRMKELRELMACGHPKACLVELTAEAPDGSMQAYADECSACEREEAAEGVRLP